jgi:hypothetical protein
MRALSFRWVRLAGAALLVGACGGATTKGETPNGARGGAVDSGGAAGSGASRAGRLSAGGDDAGGLTAGGDDAGGAAAAAASPGGLTAGGEWTGGAPANRCGNGVVERDETCDPPSSCPTDCDDGNFCTADGMTGSPSTCDVVCRNLAVTACIPEDRCCPADCDAAVDTDCSTLCGNGVVDAGETCDPPATCPVTCDDGNPCTVDLMTGSATSCNVACSHPTLTACISGDGCCPTGCTSALDIDCAS